MKKILGIILIALIVLGSFTNAQASKLEQIDIIMPWFPYYEWAPFVLGQENGIFERHGLEINLIPGKGSSVSTKMVATGKYSFGLAGAGDILKASAKGMKLKATACLHQVNPITVFFKKNSGISTPQDLKGKTISSYAQSTKRLFLNVFLEKNGIDINSVNIVSVAKEAELPIFIRDKVDVVLGFFPMEKVILESKGVNIDWFMLHKHGVKTMQTCLIVNPKVVQDNPDLVKRLTQAVISCLEYAVKNPEKAGRRLVARYAGLHKESFGEAVRFIKNKVVEKYGFGYMTKEAWQETQNILIQTGQLKKKVPLEEIYTNSFL